MALIVKDRVQQTSTTTGTGTLTLSGTVSGFQTFSSAIGNTNTTYYAIVNDAEWEVGIGTVSAGALSRDTVLESSNGGSLVNFTAGTKYVFCTYPAEKSVYKDEADKVTGYVIENSSIGATTPSTGKFTAVTTPSVTATTTDLTLSAISTGAVKFNTLGGTQAQITDVASADSYVNLSGGVGAATVSANSASGNIDLRLDSRASGSVRFRTAGSLEQMRVSHTASAVNYVQVTGGATGGSVVMSAQGSDTNIPFTYRTKGIFNHNFQTGAGATTFVVNQTGGSANYNETASSATGFATTLKTLGTDTNISMAFQPKGTGAINLAAGSSGVNISNGGTVTAITVSAIGSAYTTIPSAAVSAPTTAGGVQATANAQMGIWSSSITSGGTGYTVNDVLTVVGGTFLGGTAQQIRVTTVSAGVITAASVVNFPTYTALPTNPVSVTGGTGSGATFTLTWSVYSLAITNAGSGYIEQPTVTFSGGGGSSAAAYATVGSDSTFRTLSSTLRLVTPAGEQLRVSDSGNSTLDYVQVSGGSSPFIATGGASANSNLSISSRGTGTLFFRTNGVNQVQMQVTHTASAVNFVQVTGGATGNGSTISVQGSDANAFLAITSKGTSAIRLQTNGSNQVLINNTTSAINQIGLTGSTAGIAPQISTLGTDTNINLALTPKGTGRVQFGTYTGTILTPTGFIEIVDAGGTVRRLLVG